MQPASPRTVWGLTPAELHDRFWAARGVQVVRLGESAQLQPNAELFLLIHPSELLLFRLSTLLDTLNWLEPTLVLMRLHDSREHGYDERVITDDEDRFIRFERKYQQTDVRLGRAALTNDRQIARRWQQRMPIRQAWRSLRKQIPQNDRVTVTVQANAYYGDDPDEVRQFVRELVHRWRRPDATIDRARLCNGTVWMDRDASAEGVKFVGPVWVGAGRQLSGVQSVVGPAVLWDKPDARPQAEQLQWDRIEPSESAHWDIRVRKLTSLHRAGKRAFDIAFALAALAVTLPLYPLVMLAIWLEDGRPFFFIHHRETLGGREFPCIKFRSMRNDAEKIKAELIRENQADGPQFYIERDPRLTRVGQFLRRTNIDEMPQFLNVLVGHMSVVGPRPSPRSENQYCPPWREARLSVRPGITGMWQIYRSRQQGLDFQEWIRYDLHYVENLSWTLDLKLIWLTVKKIILRR